MDSTLHLDTQAKVAYLNHLIDQCQAAEQQIEITFTKKDGTLRVLKARPDLGEVTGKGMRYDPRARGMRPLYDTEKEAWRMANLTTTEEATVGPDRFIFLSEQQEENTEDA